MDKTIRCECGGEMVRGVRPLTFSYKGLTATVDQAGYYCTQCEESVHTGAEAAAADRALNRMKATIQGLLLPEEIRRIRQKLKLSQEAAGLFIGGGKNAFSKYERGDILPSAAASNLLRLLNEHPEGLETLRREETIESKEMARPAKIQRGTVDKRKPKTGVAA